MEVDGGRNGRTVAKTHARSMEACCTDYQISLLMVVASTRFVCISGAVPFDCDLGAFSVSIVARDKAYIFVVFLTMVNTVMFVSKKTAHLWPGAARMRTLDDGRLHGLVRVPEDGMGDG